MTHAQGHSEQEKMCKLGHTEQGDNRSQESVQKPTEQTEDRFQECVQGHNVGKKISVSVSISNPNLHMHMQLPPTMHCCNNYSLIRQFPLQNVPANGRTFLVQSMAELLKTQTRVLAAQAQAASIQSLPALAITTI